MSKPNVPRIGLPRLIANVALLVAFAAGLCHLVGWRDVAANIGADALLGLFVIIVVASSQAGDRAVDWFFRVYDSRNS